jgi:hypothetical protein
MIQTKSVITIELIPLRINDGGVRSQKQVH